MSKPITLIPITDSPKKTESPSGKIKEINTTVAEFLIEQAEKDACNLFGIVDSARNDEVFRYLVIGDVQYKSLFQDTMDIQSFGVSGFLVECKKESQLFQWMTSEAWGDSFSIFFTSKSSYDELFSHFQKFNRVFLEGDDVVLFRYYDPRVLRTYLPTCNKEEIEIFFGAVRNFFAESEEPEVINVFKQDKAANEDFLFVSSYKLTV